MSTRLMHLAHQNMCHTKMYHSNNLFKLQCQCLGYQELQYHNPVILPDFPVFEAVVRGHLGCINSSGLHHKKDKSVNCTAIWST